MKSPLNLIALLICLIFSSQNSALSQCVADYSFTSSENVVVFNNEATVSNGHFWWSFGDGTGSSYTHPIHIFPAAGKYLVTLYIEDTLSNCNDFEEMWVEVTKQNSTSCEPLLKDSVYTAAGLTFFNMQDGSSTCAVYEADIDFAQAKNFNPGGTIGLNDNSSAFVGRIQYYEVDTNDTTIPKELIGEYYKTFNHFHNGYPNFGDCSPNFEFWTVSETSAGKRVFFKAMNPDLNDYAWEVSQIPNNAAYTGDTMSHFFPYGEDDMWLVSLTINDGAGCKDSVRKQVLSRAEVMTTVGQAVIQLNDNIEIFPNPTNQILKITGLIPRSSQDILIRNASGSLVEMIKHIGTSSVEVDLSKTTPGFYFVEIRTETEIVAIEKLVVY